MLVVDCPEDEQVRRVVARSGLAAAEVRAIMATQLSRAERLARADDTLDNTGPPEAIAPQVAALDRPLPGAGGGDSARAGFAARREMMAPTRRDLRQNAASL